MLLTPREQLNKLSCAGYTADVNIEVLARGTAGFSGRKYVVCVSTVHSSVCAPVGRSDTFGKFTQD